VWSDERAKAPSSSTTGTDPEPSSPASRSWRSYLLRWRVGISFLAQGIAGRPSVKGIHDATRSWSWPPHSSIT
jgi:hypothetical protein